MLRIVSFVLVLLVSGSPGVAAHTGNYDGYHYHYLECPDARFFRTDHRDEPSKGYFAEKINGNWVLLKNEEPNRSYFAVTFKDKKKLTLVDFELSRIKERGSRDYNTCTPF